MKIANDTEGAWALQETYKDVPHGWIQWKGTRVCMDVWCKCGYHSHIDSDFAYYARCPKCKTVYFCNGHIELIECKKVDSECICEDQDYLLDV